VHGPEQQKLAVETGYWPLYRYDPRRAAAGEAPLALDSGTPKGAIGEYMRNETRFRMVEQQDPARFKAMLETTQAEIRSRWEVLQRLAEKPHTQEPAKS
jgi:pyruvate-ferredoxin/flavodoxin oxidoreductase